MSSNSTMTQRMTTKALDLASEIARLDLVSPETLKHLQRACKIANLDWQRLLEIEDQKLKTL